ncbi:serine/threonine-protein kinase [Streptomyces sp. NRRL S-1448]|uniref:serine/threonine-protein kinase n=1 Tax=Streptomyces sp. NRRL S-1448 TaxID=1463883 RepID=UPI000561A07B|nr:serine/threonine-protein kinase [Streptomyces sp. NRRL S-1448]
MSESGRLIARRYRLLERLGRGGMGTVWRAEDEVLGRQVAVKKLHVPPHLHDDEVRTLHERTRREARSAARITHPHVIVVHDVVDDEGLPCIVMEYVPSVTLSDLLKRQGALSPREAARIGGAMAGALRAAHDAGVLHRDVKPANVLLAHDGRIVLTDFGIAVVSGTPSLTRTGELVGSIQYLAPERLRSSMGEPGLASDLWSLGATLYQAVDGRPPFLRDTAIETAYAIAAEDHPHPRGAGALAPVIEGLLVKDPARRMDGSEARRLLEQVAGGQVPHVPARAPGAEEAGEAELTGAVEAGGGKLANAEAGGGKLAGAGAGGGELARAGEAGVGKLAGAGEAGVGTSAGAQVAPVEAATRREPVPDAGAPARQGRSGRRQARWLVPAAAVVAGAGVTGAVLLWPPGDGTTARTHPSATNSPRHRPSTNPTPPPPLPSGYHQVKVAQGFSLPVQDGWKRDDAPDGEIRYIDPTGLVGLRVDVVEFAGSDPLRHWEETEEAQTRRDNPGYERVRMSRTTFRGLRAGYWEFTFDGTQRGFRAVEMAFSGTDSTQYTVYLSAPEAQWTRYRPVFDTTMKGIRLPDQAGNSPS